MIAIIKLVLAMKFLVDYSGGYTYILDKLGLNIKPFNCTVCMVFWTSIVCMILGVLPLSIFTPLIAGFLIVLVDRLMGLLPINL